MPISNENQKEFESYVGTEQWNGDGWKAFAKYRQISPYLCYTITEDEGCGIIDTNIESDMKNEDRIILNLNELCYFVYEQQKDNLMNFKTEIV